MCVILHILVFTKSITFAFLELKATPHHAFDRLSQSKNLSLSVCMVAVNVDVQGAPF